MSNQQAPSDFFNSPTGTSTFKLREIFKKIGYHWPLFILFLTISFAIAYLFVKFVQPVYVINAKVLIKDPINKRNEAAALQELNLTETNKGVETEMGLMTSRPNIDQVVTDLQLWITYKEPVSNFIYKDIYSTSPVEFKLIKAGSALNKESIDIFIVNDKSFTIKRSNNQAESFLFNNELKSTFGTWKLDTTQYLKDYIGKTIRINLQNPRDVVSIYQQKINCVNYDKKNPTIDLSIEDEAPARGRAILNDLLRVYMAASVEDKRQANQNTLKFVEDRINSLTGELNNVQNNLVGFKSSRGITEIPAQSTQFLNDVQNSQDKLNSINIQISVLDGIEQYINSNQGADNPPATIGLDDAQLNSLISKLNELQLTRTKMLATLPENNPLFTPINLQINTLRSQIKAYIKGIRSTLLQTREHVKSIGSNYESSIKSLPGTERELGNINRMKEIKEDLYVYLLKKKEEISLDYASTISDARIVEQAHYDHQKSPLPNETYAIAFLAGLLLPAGLIFGRDAIKNRVISKGEIVNDTGLSVLSELVFEENPEQIRVLNNNYYISEQFRDLRTKLNYLQGKGDKGKVTLLTSSISGEGKSFVSSNLAVTLAASGKKTVILEMDLRRPQLGQIFKLEKGKPGITDYLHGDAVKAQIVQKSTLTDNLFIISCGKTPPNPSELLESDNLLTLFNDLRANYDHILIDTPPAHLVTDATILASMSDVTLYVIRQDYTPKPELEFIKEMALSKKLPRLNLIFNGVQNHKHGYGYKYTKNGYYTQSPEMVKSKFKKFFSRF